MTLNPQDITTDNFVDQISESTSAASLTGEEIVITGISGIFPNSDHVMQFKENLFNKVDMVSKGNHRWEYEHPELPKHYGIINNLEKFDAQFFKVHSKQAWIMEPMCRKLLEHAYSAIYDSGFNPSDFRRKKVGVFVGSTYSDSDKSALFEQVQRNGFGISGCNKSMFANRISYWLDVTGPSYSVDAACCSSSVCLENAYRNIRSGKCEAAIVGGCSVALRHTVVLNICRAGFLCMDGKTKCFDKNGDGYVRSDAICALFLQKAKDARRIYSEVYNAKINYNLKSDSQLLPTRNVEDLKGFLEEFYSEVNISPVDVEYIEANGSAIAEADGNELESIGRVFSKINAVKVGSVKSNMGHSDAASGNCSIIKICLAYQEGKIPPNLHYNVPQNHVPAVRDGKIEVVQETTPFNRGFAALNSLSFTGCDVHVLLKGHYKPKDNQKYATDLPYLVLASGRQDPGTRMVLDSLETHPINPEEIGLLHSIHSKDISGHMSRGYSIISTNENMETISLTKSIDYYSGLSRPICFVYSGMGSQWEGMGADLMKIPVFAASIERCDSVLSSKGIDIRNILIENDKSIFDNILNSFVGIAAVQIALTDILFNMGIIPDYIIGHSVGELGCAYADGCFTAEEMILSAYSRGLVSVQTPFIRGSMAAVGLGYNDILPLCPPEIEVACHNSSESCTISGPAENMGNFVNKLKDQNIFAKAVPCSNIAYHSRYIVDAGPNLLKCLKKIIPNPKQRSKKWLSTSVSQEKWNDPEAKYSSAEYHTNNLLSPVLFEETTKLIPSNAVVIEIAPHGLLQAILKKSLKDCLNLSLTKRKHKNAIKYMLEAIGELYKSGLNPRIDILYPKIEYPVSTETPLLSHLVSWEHSEDWLIAKYIPRTKIPSIIRNFVISLYDDDYKYCTGYIRNGKQIFPESAILVMIWETLSMSMGKNYKELSVCFRDIHFHSEVIIIPDVPLRLCITISKGSNKFEVSCDDAVYVSGVIFKKTRPFDNTYTDDVEHRELILKSRDIYKFLHYKGYTCTDYFHSIYSTSESLDKGFIKWNDDWVPFIEGIFQLNQLSRISRTALVPTLINNITINVGNQINYVKQVDNFRMLEAYSSKQMGMTKCGGVTINNLFFKEDLQSNTDHSEIQSKTFIPYFFKGTSDLITALNFNAQIVAENISADNIKIMDLTVDKKLNICDKMKLATDKIPYKFFSMKFMSTEKINSDIFVANHKIIINDLLLINNFLSNEKKMEILQNKISINTFVLAIESSNIDIHKTYKLFDVVAAIATLKHTLILLRKKENASMENITFASITNKDFSMISQICVKFQTSKRIVLILEKQPLDIPLEFVKKLQKTFTNVSLIAADDKEALNLNIDNKIFQEQIQKNLSINILKEGRWGAYYYVPNLQNIEVINFKLTSSEQGNIESLQWVEDDQKKSNDNLIEIYYAGVSKRDVQISTGEIVCDTEQFGMDFSGLNCNQQRVMGIVLGGAIGKFVNPNTELLWPVPDHWNFEEAATVPLPYTFAYYCLAIKSKIYKGCRVFVSGGAGALGQAVISICLDLECHVFTTVSDEKKKQFLLKLFPQLNARNIASSRNSSFYIQTRSLTNSNRYDIVISNFTGDLREIAMKCVAPKGYFVDVSNHDILHNKEFGMYFLFEQKSYKPIRFLNIFGSENSTERKLIQQMITEGIARGFVKPLTGVVQTPENIVRAFRIISNSRHRGRVLIKLTNLSNKMTNIIPNISFSFDGTYVIICDESDLGMELANHLVEKGVTKLVIQNSSEIKRYIYFRVQYWNTKGVLVNILSENIDTEIGCTNVLKKSALLGSVHAFFFTQSLQQETNCLKALDKSDTQSKISNTISSLANFDLLSRTLCPNLKHFVVITNSSRDLSCRLTACSLEMICRARNELGLPALYFQAESVDMFGTNLPKTETQDKLKPQTMTSLFRALGVSLKMQYANATTFSLKNKVVASDLQEIIINILGIKNINDYPEHLTLDDFLINESGVKEIKSTIRKICNLTYTSKKIRSMSMADLIKLQHKIIEKTNYVSGLSAFYSFIEDDECMGTEPIVVMSTLVGDTNQAQELDRSSTSLLMIPGFEGHHYVFGNMCERFKIQAVTMQIPPNFAENSIKDIAANLFKTVKRNFEFKSKFYVLGYSFGVNVALELSALLEKSGFKGVVYCLDSSPDALRAQINEYIGHVTEEELQNMIIRHMYKLFSRQDTDALQQELENIKEWHDKIHVCVNKLSKVVSYSREYMKSHFETAYRRILWSKNYEPDFVLESELVLLKGISHPKGGKLSAEYNLSKYSKQKVKIFQMKSDHVTLCQDFQVPNVINKFLEINILEEFKKKNMCEVYLADENKIV